MNKDSLKKEELLLDFNDRIINPINKKVNIINKNIEFYDELNIKEDLDELIKNHNEYLKSLYNEKNITNDIELEESLKKNILKNEFIFNSDIEPVKKRSEIKDEVNDNEEVYVKEKKNNYLLFIPPIIIILTIVFIILLNSKSNIFLKLNGSDPITINQGERYNDPGCTVYNNKNEIVTTNVEIINNVNINKPGTYNVICLYKNLRVERKVIVNNMWY